MDQSIFDPKSDLFKEAMEKGIKPNKSLPDKDLSLPNIQQINPNKPSTKNHIELHIDEPPKNHKHFILNLKPYNLTHPEVKIHNPQKSNKAIQTSISSSKIIKEVVKKVPKPKFAKLNKISTPQSKPTKIKENLKFLLQTGCIFIVTFVAINWQAYSQVAMTYYNDITGQTDTTLAIFSEQQEQENKLIQPSSPIISNSLVVPQLNSEITPPGFRVIIPSINSNVPVIDVSEDKLIERNWSGLEQEIQDALRSGVVHYPGTPLPGESGNVVITGHSSYYPWDPGRFKDVFALLHNLSEEDEIIIFNRQEKFTYRVSQIEKVFPYEVNVLNDFQDDRLTLITCTPIGTNLKRLIITAKLV